MNHARHLAIVPPADKGTHGEDPSLFDRVRDALGSYTAHSRLEARRVGRDILDSATLIHLAIRKAFARKSSTDWSEQSGFRCPGDYRKASCGEHPYNETDLGTVLVLDVEGFRELVDELARLAGGRFDLQTGSGTPIAQTIARLGTCTAALNSAFILAMTPGSDGGESITVTEAEVFRAQLGAIQREVAEAEAALATVRGRK